jgi:hypothetical protein
MQYSTVAEQDGVGDGDGRCIADLRCQSSECRVLSLPPSLGSTPLSLHTRGLLV